MKFESVRSWLLDIRVVHVKCTLVSVEHIFLQKKFNGQKSKDRKHSRAKTSMDLESEQLLRQPDNLYFYR